MYMYRTGPTRSNHAVQTHTPPWRRGRPARICGGTAHRPMQGTRSQPPRPTDLLRGPQTKIPPNIGPSQSTLFYLHEICHEGRLR